MNTPLTNAFRSPVVSLSFPRQFLWAWLLAWLFCQAGFLPAEEAASGTSDQPAIILVPGPEGHLSIGLQEHIGSEPQKISFEQLKNWDFSAENTAATPPQSIARLHEQNVQLNGFMFPLQEGDAIKAFLLMATTQTCCYGPRPEYNQFVLVEMANPVPFVRLKPVQIQGRFVIEPRPGDGYIFRLEGQSCLPFQGAAIQRAGAISSDSPQLLSWVEFASLAPEAQTQGLASFSLPPSWSPQPGKTVSVQGNLVIESIRDESSHLFIASQAWDGCCMGMPPSAFDSLQLCFASGTQPPSPWFKSGTLEGRLTLVPPTERNPNRFLQLSEARPVQLSENYLGGFLARTLPPPLHQAAVNEDLPGVRLFLRGGTNPNQRDAKGNSPLHFCLLPSRQEIAALLIAHGADASARNQNHQSILHEAARIGNASFAQLLLEHQADINATDSWGFTPTAWALVNGQEQTVRWLIDRGADVTICNKDGRSMLWLAAQHGLPELVQVFLDAGLNINQADRKGKTPLGAARENRQEAVIKLLESRGGK